MLDKYRVLWTCNEARIRNNSHEPFLLSVFSPLLDFSPFLDMLENIWQDWFLKSNIREKIWKKKEDDTRQRPPVWIPNTTFRNDIA